jgi:serine protease Do
MNEQELNNQNLNTSSENAEQNPAPVNYKLGIIILALLAGIIGGLFGALYLAQKPFFQKMFGYNNSGTYQQNLILNEQSATTEVVEQAGPAVVSIVISKQISQMSPNVFDPFGVFDNPGNEQSGSSELRQVGAGTGFFVSSDGMIVTNKHVVSDDTAQYSVITNDGKSYDAKVLSKDPVNDIAIIKIDIRNAPFLNFADSSTIQLGQHVIAIGNSLGEYQNTVTAGIISGIGRSVIAGGMGELEQLDGVIQTDAAINSGNSGGPLLDLSGKVIGINTAADRQGQSIGFAIPSNDVKVALDSYRNGGKIVRPFLGVRYMMITEAVAKSENLPKDFGALIIRGNSATDFAVQPGSPADKAGLQENDIIMEVNGDKLTEQNSLTRVLKKYKPNDSLTLKVFSKGQEKTVIITVGETQ